MKNISLREKILIAATTFVAISAVSYRFFFEPVAKRWFLLRHEAEINQREFLNHKTLLAKYSIIKKEYEKLPGFSESSHRPEKEIAGVLSEIEGLANNAHLEILSLKPQAARKTEGYTEVQVEVTASAGVSELSQFLYDIENNEKLLKIKRMRISGSSQEKSLRCSFFIIKVFFD